MEDTSTQGAVLALQVLDMKVVIGRPELTGLMIIGRIISVLILMMLSHRESMAAIFTMGFLFIVLSLPFRLITNVLS